LAAVYFLYHPDKHLIKIGWTRRDIESRVSEHQSRSRGRLVLLKAIPGGRDLERRLHQRFADRRVKGTEYFVPSRELESVLGSPICPAPSRPIVKFLEPEPTPEPPEPPSEPAKDWVGLADPTAPPRRRRRGLRPHPDQGWLWPEHVAGDA
jgi:Meiotically up-regulated gene 113